AAFLVSSATSISIPSATASILGLRKLPRPFEKRVFRAFRTATFIGNDLVLLRMKIRHGLKVDLFLVATLKLVERLALVDREDVDDVGMRLDQDLRHVPLDPLAFDLTE